MRSVIGEALGGTLSQRARLHLRRVFHRLSFEVRENAALRHPAVPSSL